MSWRTAIQSEEATEHGKAHMPDGQNASKDTPAPSTGGDGTTDSGSHIGSVTEDPGPIDVGSIWRNHDPWEEAETREAPQSSSNEDAESS